MAIGLCDVRICEAIASVRKRTTDVRTASLSTQMLSTRCQWMLQMATAFSRLWIIVVRNQVLRRHRLLNDLSEVQDVTGQISSKRINCSTCGYSFRTSGCIDCSTFWAALTLTYDFWLRNILSSIERLGSHNSGYKLQSEVYRRQLIEAWIPVLYKSASHWTACWSALAAEL